MNLVLVDGDKYKDMIAGRMKKPKRPRKLDGLLKDATENTPSR